MSKQYKFFRIPAQPDEKEELELRTKEKEKEERGQVCS